MRRVRSHDLRYLISYLQGSHLVANVDTLLCSGFLTDFDVEMVL